MLFQNLSLCTRKAKENGEEGMSMFGDGRESAGLVCTEDIVGAAMLGILEKYLKILNAF